ncbi:unnamed protein product [Zymoseptoria tritici ST99CH_3D1]|nr:unnamed protein product [Zymoseptoria tritici ST99CH_3D1]
MEAVTRSPVNAVHTTATHAAWSCSLLMPTTGTGTAVGVSSPARGEDVPPKKCLLTMGDQEYSRRRFFKLQGEHQRPGIPPPPERMYPTLEQIASVADSLATFTTDDTEDEAFLVFQRML